MDGFRFDTIARALGAHTDRRRGVRVAVGALLGSGLLIRDGRTSAKEKTVLCCGYTFREDSTSAAVGTSITRCVKNTNVCPDAPAGATFICVATIFNARGCDKCKQFCPSGPPQD